LGGEEEAGDKMKSKQGWAKGGNGTNSSGFSGLPGGYRGYSGVFYSIGYLSFWWSSTEKYSTNYAWYRSLSYFNGSVYRSIYGNKGSGLSVRCRRD
jgi:uncharacterized protein (TIGR02145 family)